ncbi:hypothetical protein Vadar_018259 [Vaccinium darrowii]|uniref:Uncharacterized protein n=1 Tax=Vaccinium darrowii TaxID=229202 RepID=A0ACB7Y813_9ERIC|nr:hypothetical protein Vadar_018259 [Vaccinium darrowii]
MRGKVSKQMERIKSVSTEEKALRDLQESSCCNFPGCDYHPPDRKNWMLGLNPEKVLLHKMEDRRVCHGILLTYSVVVVINDIKQFLAETQTEIIILEIRTEFGHKYPPEFDKYLEEQLGELLIHNDDSVFEKTIAGVLPKRVVCVQKQKREDHDLVWENEYLRKQVELG